MSDFEVRTSRGTYSVSIGSGISRTLLQSDEIKLCDARIMRHLGADEGTWIPFESTEQHKTLDGCQEVLTAMHGHGMRRGTSLIAIGGGVIQDVATLSASLYMRGVPWVYVPTTAMAMLDSCIGGKSSINAGGIKNLVGNIYPPKAVLVDVDFARTLSVEAQVSGLSEAVKICFTAGSNAFADFVNFNFGPDDLRDDSHHEEAVRLIRHVLGCKRWFIEIDEFDVEERLLLNFGHTFGHALESATNFAIPHGIAVSFGMLAALNHPLSASNESSAALAEYLRTLLLAVPDAVSRVQSPDWTQFERAVALDKKGSPEELRFILPESGGGVAIVGVPRNQSSMGQAVEAMRAAIDHCRT